MNNFLTKSNILFFDIDESSRSNYITKFSSYFKKMFSVSNKKEAIDTFINLNNQNIKLHGIICDLEEEFFESIIYFLKSVRLHNKDIPFVVITGDINKNYLLQLMKYDVTSIYTKPINTQKILNSLDKYCNRYYQNERIRKQKYELDRYVLAVDKVAIVSKTDIFGKIIFANELFVETSKYSLEELIGSPQSIIRHPDNSKEIFKDMWSVIKSGNVWQGNLKNLNKEGEEYYVNATIFPIFDELTDEIIEYIGIRFLTTTEEIAKRDFRKKVMFNLQESKKRESEYIKLINFYKQKINLLTQNSSNNLENKILELQTSNNTLKLQIDHSDNEIKILKQNNQKLIDLANIKIKKVTEEFNNLRVKYNSTEISLKKLIREDEMKKEKILELEFRLKEKNTQIENLFEVINEKDKDIAKLKEKDLKLI